MPPEPEQVVEEEDLQEDPAKVEELSESEEFFATTEFVDEDVPDDEELLPKEEQGDGEATPLEEEQKPVEEPAPVEEPKEEPAPVEAEPAVLKEPVPEVVPEPVAAPEEPKAPAPDPEAAPQLTDEQVQEAMITWRTNALGALEDHFKLDEETVIQLEEDSGKAMSEFLPKMASRVYLDAVQMAVHSVVQKLPEAIKSTMAQMKESTSSEGKFFEKWPQMSRDNPQQMAVVGRLGGAYRQANPEATPEQFINDVGAQAILALGLLGQVAGVAPVDPAAPVAPVVPPFKPAGNAAPAAPKGNAGQNPITIFDDAAFGDDLDLD